MEVSLMGIYKEERGLAFAWIRGRNQCSGLIKAPCVASATAGTEGEKDQMARLSA